jgi:hypothetical protein
MPVVSELSFAFHLIFFPQIFTFNIVQHIRNGLAPPPPLHVPIHCDASQNRHSPFSSNIYLVSHDNLRKLILLSFFVYAWLTDDVERDTFTYSDQASDNPLKYTSSSYFKV